MAAGITSYDAAPNSWVTWMACRAATARTPATGPSTAGSAPWAASAGAAAPVTAPATAAQRIRIAAVGIATCWATSFSGSPVVASYAMNRISAASTARAADTGTRHRTPAIAAPSATPDSAASQRSGSSPASASNATVTGSTTATWATAAVRAPASDHRPAMSASTVTATRATTPIASPYASLCR